MQTETAKACECRKTQWCDECCPSTFEYVRTELCGRDWVKVYRVHNKYRTYTFGVPFGFTVTRDSDDRRDD